MANPSKRYPHVIEMRGSGDKWFAVEAFRDADEARAMLPVLRKRAAKSPTPPVLRLRDIREEGTDHDR